MGIMVFTDARGGVDPLRRELPMCLAIPMQVLAIDGLAARCEAKGVERQVSLFLLQFETLNVGDHVAVHAGQAIQKLSAEQAQSAWEVYDQMLASESAQGGAGTA
jgi:hydrogenase expression/formation protein HypC